MKPFLVVSIREQDDAAAAEFRSVCRFGGLAEGEAVHVRADKAPLGPLDPHSYAGFIFGGSPFNASDDAKSDVQVRVEAELGALVDQAIAEHLPVLGICYGVGLVTARLGGLVDRRYTEKVGPVEVTVNDAGRRDPLFAGVPERFAAFTGHKEACSIPPADAVVLATGEICPVQAYRVGEAVYVTQFHSELDAEALAERMRIYVNHGYFRPDELEVLIEQAYAAGIDETPGRVLANFVALARAREAALSRSAG